MAAMFSVGHSFLLRKNGESILLLIDFISGIGLNDWVGLPWQWQNGSTMNLLKV